MGERLGGTRPRVAVFERKAPAGWFLALAGSYLAWLVLLPLGAGLWYALGLAGFLARTLPVSRLAADATLWGGLILGGLAPTVWLAGRVRRRFGRAELYPEHVAFEWALSTGYHNQEHVPRERLQVSRVSPRGILLASPGRQLLRDWFFPLFVPAAGDEEQARALRLLEGRGQEQDWDRRPVPSTCRACRRPCLTRRPGPAGLCAPCWREQNRAPSRVLVLLVVLGVLCALVCLLWS